MKAYVNGVEVISTTFSTLNLKNEIPYIGSNYNNSSFFNGKIDDLRIYGDILTPTEVEYIKDNETGNIPSDNLLAHYKLDGDATDETGSYNGTATSLTYSDPAESPSSTQYNGTATNVTYQEATNFSPDLVWTKRRDTTGNHLLYDSIRGAGFYLTSNSTSNENGSAQLDTLASFD